MTTFAKTTQIDAPKDDVWAVLADIGSISEWSPSVMKSHSTSDAPGGNGATRHCEVDGPGGKTAHLEERAFDWREGESFKIDIYESSLPLKRNIVSFAVKESGSGTQVTVSPDYQLKFGPIGMLMDKIMVRSKFEQGMESMLAGLKEHVENGAKNGS